MLVPLRTWSLRRVRNHFVLVVETLKSHLLLLLKSFLLHFKLLNLVLLLQQLSFNSVKLPLLDRVRRNAAWYTWLDVSVLYRSNHVLLKEVISSVYLIGPHVIVVLGTWLSVQFDFLQ